MKEYFDLTESYGFKAPLVEVPDSFPLAEFMRACSSLSVTPKVMELVGQITHACLPYSLGIISLDHAATSLGKSKSIIRTHLQTLAQLKLVETEYVTTDPIRRRRGVLFRFRLPNANEFAETLTQQKVGYNGSQDIAVVSLEQMGTQVKVSENNETYGGLLATRFLAKAMRTNRKDKRTSLSIHFTTANGIKVPIVSEAEGGRLMAVPDLAYYCGALTWLFNHVELEIRNGNSITTETFNIPLDQIIVLSKKASAHAATTQGYGNAAIEALRRTSVTSFNLEDLPSDARDRLFQEEQIFYKLLRLEGVAKYKDGSGRARRMVRVQFPQSTVKSVVNAVESGTDMAELVLIADELLKSKNEVEILFGLWARDMIYSGHSNLARRTYSWNELREQIAPNSKLNEFKRKFSSFLIANRDRSYKPSEQSKERLKKLTLMNENVWVNENAKREYVVEYAKAIAHGLIINVGFDELTQATSILIRQHISGIHIKYPGNNRIKHHTA